MKHCSNHQIVLICSMLLSSGAPACNHDNPDYCPGAPHNNCLELDAALDGPRQCTNDECTGTQPLCGNDHMCHACAAHSDCPTSLACLPDGSCGTDSSVAYVDPTGDDHSNCTHPAPCSTVSRALATGRPFVKFHGATSEQVSIFAQNVTLLADPGAQLIASSGGFVLEVSGGAHVAIYDLELTGGSGVAGYGIVLPQGNGATLEVHRAKITRNFGGGIIANGGSVIVAQSTISSNRGGGISIFQGAFDITNNFIVDNGDAGLSGSDTGGLTLTSAPGANRLEFNSIAYNHVQTGTLFSAGVACAVTDFVAPNNIVTSNNEGVMFLSQTKGSCAFGNSYTAPGSADNALGFRAPASIPLDLHLTPSSPASVVDAAGACTGKDIDGDVRPIGGACDLGADERNP